MADLIQRLGDFVDELRRRRVFRVAAVYAVVAWVVVQVAVATFPVLLLPAWMTRAVVVIAAMGFPVAVALAWAFRITPEEDESGTTDTTHPKLVPAGPAARAALVLVVLVTSAGAGMAAWQGWLTPEPDGGSSRSSLDPFRVGVLYFDDYSPDRDLEPVADAFTESLIHHLAQIEPLDVVSRNGMKPYRDPEIPSDSIARLLGAGHLVEGSVERTGDRLLVHVQLIDGETATHLASTRVERSGEDLLSLRDEIVRRVARLLQRQLGEELQVREFRSGTDVTRAWRLFHRARDAAELGDSLRFARDPATARTAYREADSLLARAESLDPTWAEPTVERGWVAYGQAFLAGATVTSLDADALRRGIRHANRVLRSDPGQAAALELRGALRYRLSNLVPPDSAAALLRTAEADLRRAVDVEPDRAVAWIHLADLLINQGRFAEAKLAARESREADPFLENESDLLSLAANIALQLENFDRAWRITREGLTRFPENPYFGNVALAILAGAGAPGTGVPAGSAWAILERTRAAMPEGRWPEGELLVAAVLAKQGEGDSARSVLKRATDGISENPITHYYRANVHLHLRERDRALRSLGEALEAAPQLGGIASADWWWAPLRDDARFRKLTGLDSAETEETAVRP